MVSAIQKFRHRLAKTKVHAPLTWMRHRTLTSKDVFIASYPRSGSTWLRFLLLEILTGDSADFEKVNKGIPDVGNQREGLPLLPPKGRLIKTHEPYRTEYKRAIYLVRDGRDVALSEYAFEKRFGMVYKDFDEFLTLFLRGKVNGYGSWHDHVHSWLESPLASSGDLLVIKFEDVRRNPQDTLAQILGFLGLEVDRRTIQAAVQNNTVERMREKEDSSRQMGKSDEEERRFVRSGSLNGWRSKLTEAQVMAFERHAGSALARAGYPLSEIGLMPTSGQ